MVVVVTFQWLIIISFRTEHSTLPLELPSSDSFQLLGGILQEGLVVYTLFRFSGKRRCNVFTSGQPKQSGDFPVVYLWLAKWLLSSTIPSVTSWTSFGDFNFCINKTHVIIFYFWKDYRWVVGQSVDLQLFIYLFISSSSVKVHQSYSQVKRMRTS